MGLYDSPSPEVRDLEGLHLYHFVMSNCSQRVRLGLEEKGLEWTSHHLNLPGNEHVTSDYQRINPNGVVPTLVHDGAVIIESTLICEYLDDCFPNPKLIPDDPYQRARMRLWSKAVDEGLHEGVVELSFSAMFRERMHKMPEEKRQERFRNVGDAKRRDRFMSTFELGVESPFVFQAVGAYEKAFLNMEDALGQGGDWLLGDDYSLADINMIPYVARLDYLTLMDIWTADRPQVMQWWARVKTRPSFEVGINSKLKPGELEEMRQSGPKIKDRIRQIRSEYLVQFK